MYVCIYIYILCMLSIYSCVYLQTCQWRFPERGHPEIIHFHKIFHYEPSSHGGFPGASLGAGAFSSFRLGDFGQAARLGIRVINAYDEWDMFILSSLLFLLFQWVIMGYTYSGLKWDISEKHDFVNGAHPGDTTGGYPYNHLWGFQGNITGRELGI